MNTRLKVIENNIALLRAAVTRSSRISTQDCADIIGLHRRSAQRYLADLERLGYLVGDGCTPLGYKATDKTKQLFGVKGESK
ncbi:MULTISPECIES: helix-turn-helix domain-containing protein [Acinetobacter]|uniref:HTH domain-containing protein n=1 Tax=Acinetobacter junii TaxID=40215 RepID=A0A365PME5_ACIJU|nr:MULTISPECIES: helix-turn-helix domain-containing protein [Acinetobacter]RBA42350.1 hypothetical protein DDF86_00360 [Acinetobacter junii]RBA42920.1 hypothetical protein DDG62_01605 [Acinetobacter junii]RBA49825.1 hypothetical protein DC346_01985 [Acinetobacter junii]WLF73456.1 hypothetical protein Q4617_05455 [Acinetobacter junii]